MKAGDTYSAVDLYFTDTETEEPKLFPVGATGRAQIREIRSNALLLEWPVTINANVVTLDELTPAQTQGVEPGLHAIEVQVSTVDGRTTTWVRDARIEVYLDRTYG